MRTGLILKKHLLGHDLKKISISLFYKKKFLNDMLIRRQLKKHRFSNGLFD